MEFTLFGFPVRVQITFWIFTALLGFRYLSMGGQDGYILLASWVAIAFVGVLIHELGHAFTFKAFGVDSEILFHWMGGLTQPRMILPLKAWQFLLVSLAGPGVGIVVGTAAVLVDVFGPIEEGSLGDEILWQVQWVNLGWALLNLLPVLPLDGGNVMRSLFDMLTKGKGLRPALYVSIGVGVVAGGLSLLSGGIWGAMLCAMFTYGNIQALRQTSGPRRDPTLPGRLAEARQLLERGDPDRAIAVAEALVRDSQTSDMRAAALQVVAYAQIAREDVEAAAQAVKRFPNDQIPDLALQGIVLLADDRPEDAIAPLRSAYDRSPNRLTGMLLLEALCSSGRFEGAVDFLAGPAGRIVGEEAFRRVVPAAFEAEAFAESARAGKVWFEQTKIPEVAYNVACALARDGRPGEAVEWLRRAVDVGFKDLPMLEQDADLAPLRERPEYAEIRERIERRAAT